MTNRSHPVVDRQELDEAVKFIKAKTDQKPEIGLILGSGLGPFADEVEKPTIIAAGEIPYYPASTVSGHAGRWVVGKLGDKVVLVMQGRVHGYEGYPFHRLAFPVHIMAKLGVGRLIITNAAGGLNRHFKPGDLMIISDHLNLMFDNPLIGVNVDDYGPRFPDMEEPYNRELILIAEKVGADLGLPLRKGVLGALKGPTYESAAEVRMMQWAGVDAGTMSTIPEVITAAFYGIRVLGISCITNAGTGMTGKKLDHTEVTEVANLVKERFSRLIREIVRRI